MMFEEDAFDHVEFILCIQFIGASKGSEARLYQWSFVNNQHCSSDGCNWVGLGETITNYKVSSCPFACHRLRPTLPANFFTIFLSKSLSSIFGCLIFLAAAEFDFFGCHFMPLSSLTNSFVMLSLEQ